MGREKQYRIITSGDFEQIDMGIYECETITVVWGNQTNLLITCQRAYAGYGYDDQAVTQYAKQSNMCLDWIEKNKEYIQRIISENSRFQSEYGFEMAGKSFLDRLCLRKIEMEICVQDETQETFACMYMEVKPFLFHDHCHCIEVAIQAQKDGMYKADLIEDVQGLLLELRSALKEKNAEACNWAKNHGIFYAFDAEGNMLAVVKQRFCLSIEGKLISETKDDRKKQGVSGNKLERSVLYFIWAKWKIEKHCADSWKGIPMPLGFVTKELICKSNVFTIISSSGHEAVSGTFLVMHEALTMIEMLYCTRGVTEEEIEQCYYTFLVEDHRKTIAEQISILKIQENMIQ